jgi:hypothetical protein
MLRGGAYVALAAKFLVPIGYMPASLADGGPIRLCDAGPLAELPTRSAAPGDHASHAHEEHADGHAASSHSVPENGPAVGHDHDDSSAGHHDWERCALGGLASLAALAGDGHIALPPLRPVRVAIAEVAPFSPQTVVPFRSRAPPLAHS